MEIKQQPAQALDMNATTMCNHNVCTNKMQPLEEGTSTLSSQVLTWRSYTGRLGHDDSVTPNHECNNDSLAQIDTLLTNMMDNRVW